MLLYSLWFLVNFLHTAITTPFNGPTSPCRHRQRYTFLPLNRQLLLGSREYGFNHNGQLGDEIYTTMLNELNCTFGTSFFYVFIAVAVMVMVCGLRGIDPSVLGSNKYECTTVMGKSQSRFDLNRD